MLFNKAHRINTEILKFTNRKDSNFKTNNLKNKKFLLTKVVRLLKNILINSKYFGKKYKKNHFCVKIMYCKCPVGLIKTFSDGTVFENFVIRYRNIEFSNGKTIIIYYWIHKSSLHT